MYQYIVLLYQLLVHVIFGIFIAIYLKINLYICCFAILLSLIISKIFSKLKFLLYVSLGFCIGFTSLYLHTFTNNVSSGVVSYVGNNCVFLENRGLYYLHENDINIGDKLNFTAHGNSIKNIMSVSKGSLMLPFIADHREYVKSFCMKAKNSGFWMAIMLGDKSYISNEDMKSLFDSSIYHIIVISGFHLSMIYYCIYRCIYYFVKKSKKLNYYSTIYASYDIIPHSIAAFVCFYYFLITISGISSIRAIIMILMKKSNYSNKSTLLLLMIISILYNSDLIFNKGFLLSYLITFLLLEKQSNARISLFSLTITRMINPLALVNNAIGTGLIYILFPVSFIGLMFHSVEILNMFNSLVNVFFNYLPKWNLLARRVNIKLMELMVVSNYIYFSTMKALYLYIAVFLFALSFIFETYY